MFGIGDTRRGQRGVWEWFWDYCALTGVFGMGMVLLLDTVSAKDADTSMGNAKLQDATFRLRRGQA